MPTYEYECDEPGEGCDGHFETIQRMSEDALTHCPTCGSVCRRIISAVPASRGTGDILQHKNLERTGFSMYKNQGDGTYDRVGGASGPDRPDKIGADGYANSAAEAVDKIKAK